LNDAEPIIRKFNLADSMIAVAASAATLALAKLTLPVIAEFRQEYEYLTHLPPSRPPGTSLRFEYLEYLSHPVRMTGLWVAYHIQAIILVWMVAYAAMRLRRPRPPLRVVSLQPGMVAFGAASASAFATGLLTLFADGRWAATGPVAAEASAFATGLLMLFGGKADHPVRLARFGPDPGAVTLFVGDDAIVRVPALAIVSLAIPLAWGTLKATRRWRPEASWVDRLGRALGLCWWVVTWIGAAFLGYVTAMWDTPGFLLPPWARHG